MDTETIREITGFCLRLFFGGIVVYWAIVLLSVLIDIRTVLVQIRNELMSQAKTRKD